MNKNIKIKPLNKKQLILYFDRLTRFKYPEIKFKRVFSDIILKNLISPKCPICFSSLLGSNNEMKMNLSNTTISDNNLSQTNFANRILRNVTLTLSFTSWEVGHGVSNLVPEMDTLKICQRRNKERLSFL